MRGRERILASWEKALRTIGLIKNKYSFVTFVLQHFENLGEVTGGEFPGSEISLHFLPQWNFLLCFCSLPFLLVMGFLCCPSYLPFAGLGIFAPEGLNFFPGRVPSEKKPFTGKALTSFPVPLFLPKHNFPEWRAHYRLFTLVTLFGVLREGTFCIDKVPWNVLLKVKIGNSRP